MSMNKSNIEWTDYTWNPVTGCLHGCYYCYARKIANRFGVHYKSESKTHTLTHPLTKDGKSDGKNLPFPYDFLPTFHGYRLQEPTKLKKPSTIFVCSMADLFGHWVKDEWIREVFQACEAAPQHTYIFLTKNPKRYREFEFSPNCFIGTSASNQQDYDSRCAELLKNKGKVKLFLSLEPLHEEIDLDTIPYKWLDWIIVGAQTGTKAINPKKEWIESIIKQAELENIPLFLKDNLGLNICLKIQEFPEGMC